MKQWISKLMNQLDIRTNEEEKKSSSDSDVQILSEEKATILYFLDIYNKSLFEIENHSVRKVREKLDKLSRELVAADSPKQIEAVLFDIRQFFSSYRIDESTFIQNSFDDFKRIVWDFADQLSEDLEFESNKEKELANHLQGLKEAVDMNSIDLLRQKSRSFINTYVEYQSQKNEIKQKRMATIKKNLSSIKKQLTEANNDLKFDHLTGAFNRKAFEEKHKAVISSRAIENKPSTLIMLDIDHFKKINDNYGHDIGDFVLKQCVSLLKECFKGDGESVSRLGGEEFAVLLEGHDQKSALIKAEAAMARIRNEVFIQGEHQIKFTISMGLAQGQKEENASDWLKRADLALYQSKNTGRNKITIAHNLKPSQVA